MEETTVVEELEPFLEQAKARLAQAKDQRLQMLERVTADLRTLLRDAQLLHDRELADELRLRLEAAELERQRLTGESGAVAEREAELGEAGGRSEPARGRHEVMQPVQRPVPGVPRAVQRAPRVWVPRPVEVLDAEVAHLEDLLDEEPGNGDLGLLRLKALACRQRRAYWELEAQGAFTGHVRGLYGKLKTRIQEQHGINRRVLPLNTNVMPPLPTDWEELAARYEALVPAWEVWIWYTAHQDALGPAAAKDLLESVGAIQQQLFRVVMNTFRDSDDQQKELYEKLLRAASEKQIYIESLNYRRSDEELARAAASLEPTFERLMESTQRRARQNATLERVMDLVADPEYLEEDEGLEELREAVAECLEAGIPPSYRELRDALLPYAEDLADEPRVAPLLREIEKELERRGQHGAGGDEGDEHGDEAQDEDEDDEGDLSPDIRRQLEELLPHIRGKRVLFIGGEGREEKRRQLEQILEVDLSWPGTRPTDSVYDFEAGIARSDIVALLVRFMRTGHKQAIDLCEKYGVRLVRLPRGLGISRVISDFHDQLVSRHDAGR